MRGKGIHSKSIFVQLIVFSLLTSLVPILIISIFLFYKLDNTAQTETKNYHEQITSQYMKKHARYGRAGTDSADAEEK